LRISRARLPVEDPSHLLKEASSFSTVFSSSHREPKHEDLYATLKSRARMDVADQRISRFELRQATEIEMSADDNGLIGENSR
jgi:hypothetical protein